MAVESLGGELYIRLIATWCVRNEASGGRAALAHVTQESLTCLVNIARKQFHMSCAYMYAGDHKATSAARQGDS